MKRLYIFAIVLFIGFSMLMISGCSSQSNKNKENSESSGSETHYIYYGEKIFSDELLDISLEKIEKNNLYLQVKNKSKKEDFVFTIKALALDGRNQYKYNNILCGTSGEERWELKHGTDTEVIQSSLDGFDLSHKRISVIFQLSGSDGSVVETKEANFDNLKESAHQYGEYTDNELLYKSENITVWYSNIHSAGLYFLVQNKQSQFITLSYDYFEEGNSEQKIDSSSRNNWLPSKCSTIIVACGSSVVESGKPGTFKMTVFKECSDDVVEEVNIPYSELKVKYDALGANW